MEHKIYTLEEVEIPHGNLIDADVLVMVLRQTVIDEIKRSIEFVHMGCHNLAHEIGVEVNALQDVIKAIEAMPVIIKANPGE
jgi:hypothetical protein